MYAGALDSRCYCASTLDAGTGAVSDRARCDRACPGNGAEYCGGGTSSKRAEPSDVLLSVYGNIDGLNATTPPPAPALGSNTSNSNASLPISGDLITSTVTYTTVCETNPAQLVTLTYSTTITVCPVCPASQPSIPLTTLTQSCAACGKNGWSTVTLAVPVHVIVTKTANGTVTATGYLKNPTATPRYFPVSAAAPPRGSATGVLMALLGFVGMLI